MQKSLIINVCPLKPKVHLGVYIRLGTVSKLGYLLANCHFSSGPVQIAYQPPLTSDAGTIESVTNAHYVTLPPPRQPIT